MLGANCDEAGQQRRRTPWPRAPRTPQPSILVAFLLICNLQYLYMCCRAARNGKRRHACARRPASSAWRVKAHKVVDKIAAYVGEGRWDEMSVNMGCSSQNPTTSATIPLWAGGGTKCVRFEKYKVQGIWFWSLGTKFTLLDKLRDGK